MNTTMTIRRTFAAALLAIATVLCAGCATGPDEIRRPALALVPSIWPVDQADAVISSKFGLRGEGAAARHHNGIDISAPKGTPVVATADGMIAFSGRSGSYGQAVMITHTNGVETCYAHLSKRNAKRGRTILQGQRIGKVGHSGRADGPHLHYEVRINGMPTDPAPFLPPKNQPETPERK